MAMWSQDQTQIDHWLASAFRGIAANVQFLHFEYRYWTTNFITHHLLLIVHRIT